MSDPEAIALRIGALRHEAALCGLLDSAQLRELFEHIDALDDALERAQEALLSAHHAIVSLDEDVFGPIIDGHGGHCGWVRDQLLSNMRAALSNPLPKAQGED